jgi:hypothetical protein
MLHSAELRIAPRFEGPPVALLVVAMEQCITKVGFDYIYPGGVPGSFLKGIAVEDESRHPMESLVWFR